MDWNRLEMLKITLKAKTVRCSDFFEKFQDFGVTLDLPTIYEDGYLIARARGGGKTLAICRFFLRHRIALRFGMLSDELNTYVFHQKLSKSVHGARRTMPPKLATRKFSVFPCFRFVFPIGRYSSAL